MSGRYVVIHFEMTKIERLRLCEVAIYQDTGIVWYSNTLFCHICKILFVEKYQEVLDIIHWQSRWNMSIGKHELPLTIEKEKEANTCNRVFILQTLHNIRISLLATLFQLCR